MDPFVSVFTLGQQVPASFQGQEADLALIFLTTAQGYIKVPYPGDKDSFSIVAGPTLGKVYNITITGITSALPMGSIGIDIS